MDKWGEPKCWGSSFDFVLRFNHVVTAEEGWMLGQKFAFGVLLSTMI